jgi:NADPH-dependent glutamate synthase beta subunit-like oxidoreductase
MKSFGAFRKDLIDERAESCSLCEDLILEEAEYEGRKVTLNDPIRTSENPNKKFKVYVRNEQGNVVVVRFGDPNMEIKRDDPGRRKNFRARHNCDNPGPKWKARYWSCWQWRAGAKVDN